MLKPDHHTAVLVLERVRECIDSDQVSKAEQIALESFSDDLERYLK